MYCAVLALFLHKPELLFAALVFMSEKECYSVLSVFLDQIEKQYCLEKGSYRITFYPRQDVMVCFSVIAADKSRIRIENNVLVSFTEYRKAKFNSQFKYVKFTEQYFLKNLTQYNSLDASDKVQILTEALNEIYLDQAVVPTQLL